jgi:adenylate cyclase
VKDIMGETRKLAAIMAVDVVGYSRLMGEDEAGTARAVRGCREAAAPIVASLGGRVVKTMGDSLLLEFPSAVTAVECAMTIQKTMATRNADTPDAKRVVYRIGVNVGDVLIDDEDILGDSVNIAARLESVCKPGGVSISRAVYDQIRLISLWGEKGFTTILELDVPSQTIFRAEDLGDDQNSERIVEAHEKAHEGVW